MTQGKERYVVLLSGGQDSTTALFWAKKKFGENCYPISFTYGQRHSSEIDAASKVLSQAFIPHERWKIIEMEEQFKALSESALLDEVSPINSDGGLLDSEAEDGLPTSFVPGRNLVFLVAAAQYAVKIGSKHLVTGVCQTDYSGYPDCRREFIDVAEAAINLAMPSSARRIEIHTPLMYLTKKETVDLAVDLGVQCMNALAYTVTCYEGKSPGCGKCPACVLREQGFKEAGVKDPAKHRLYRV